MSADAVCGFRAPKCSKIRFRPELHPDPHRESSQRSPYPFAAIMGLTSKGKTGTGQKGREKTGRTGKGKERRGQERLGSCLIGMVGWTPLSKVLA